MKDKLLNVSRNILSHVCWVMSPAPQLINTHLPQRKANCSLVVTKKKFEILTDAKSRVAFYIKIILQEKLLFALHCIYVPASEPSHP